MCKKQKQKNLKGKIKPNKNLQNILKNSNIQLLALINTTRV